jgi:hypothetical protein
MATLQYAARVELHGAGHIEPILKSFMDFV